MELLKKIKRKIKNNLYLLITFIIRIFLFTFYEKKYGYGRKFETINGSAVLYDVNLNYYILYFFISITFLPLIFGQKIRFFLWRILFIIVFFYLIPKPFLILIEFIPLFDFILFLKNIRNPLKEEYYFYKNLKKKNDFCSNISRKSREILKNKKKIKIDKNIQTMKRKLRNKSPSINIYFKRSRTRESK